MKTIVTSCIRSGKRLLALLKEVVLLKPYYTIVGVPAVWHYRNRVGVDRYKHDPGALSAEGTRIRNELLEHGIALSSLDALFPDQDLLSVLRARTQTLRIEARRREKKPFLLEMWELVPTLHSDDPFITLALSPSVLDPINGYMGTWTRFYYHMLGIVEPGGQGAQARESQRWHRDPEDIRMCKFFVYLSDVDTTSGPFTYVKGSHLGGPYRSVFPQQRPRGVYPPEGGVEAQIPADAFQVCTGVAGTVIFADTSGLHRGGYATEKERVMYTAGFMSDAASTPLRYQLPSPATEFDALPERVRFALSRI